VLARNATRCRTIIPKQAGVISSLPHPINSVIGDMVGGEARSLDGGIQG